MSEKDLLPCPFCGDDTTDPPYESEDGYWGIVCDKCMAKVGTCPLVEDVIANWNRRTPTAPPAVVPESVRRDAEMICPRCSGRGYHFESQRLQEWCVTCAGQGKFKERRVHYAPTVGLEDTVLLAQLQRIEDAAKKVVEKAANSPIFNSDYVMDDLRAALASLPSQPDQQEK